MRTVYDKIRAALASMGKAVTQTPHYTYIVIGLLVLIALAIGLPLGLTSGCGGLPADAVAKVGDQVIYSVILENQTEQVASSQYFFTEDQAPEAYDQIRRAELENLVIQAIAMEKAPELGIEVTDEEVQTQIDTARDMQFGGDEEALKQYIEETLGLTLGQLEQQIRVSLTVPLVYEEITKDITAVSDEEVEAYYEEYKDTFLTDTTVKARHILVAVSDDFERGTSDETEYSELDWARALYAAAKVRLDLLSGGSWKQLAARYSDDTETKDSGGRLGEVVEGDLEEAFGRIFETELFALEVDEISDLLETANGYHVIQVTEIIEPRVMTLEEAREEAEAAALYQAWDDALTAWLDEAKLELEIIYSKDLQPTTTTLATTTTLSPEATTTTIASESTTTTAE